MATRYHDESEFENIGEIRDILSNGGLVRHFRTLTSDRLWEPIFRQANVIVNRVNETKPKKIKPRLKNTFKVPMGSNPSTSHLPLVLIEAMVINHVLQCLDITNQDERDAAFNSLGVARKNFLGDPENDSVGTTDGESTSP